MSDVRSKNLYELLGNDPEQDPELKQPDPPAKAIDKTAPRHGKRDAPTEPRASNPANARGGRGGRGGRFTGNEQAFRDRNAGSQNNRGKPVDEAPREKPTGGVKNRDGRGHLIRDDRQARNDKNTTDKQTGQGWGARSGESEWKDEQAGEAIAQNDENEATGPAEGNEEGEEKEPEEKAKSYADYLAELAENKREELGVKEARKPNEGVKVDKKWAQAKELKRGDDEDSYIKGKDEKGGKREKARKEKNYLDVDMRYVEPARGRGDGPRGRGRGGRGRGDGFRGRGNGAPRGGRGAGGPTVDEKNFPSLGSK